MNRTETTLVEQARLIAELADQRDNALQTAQVRLDQIASLHRTIDNLRADVARCAKAKQETDADTDAEVAALKQEIEELRRARDAWRDRNTAGAPNPVRITDA